jgi:signal transduction histidine kinase
LRQRSVRTYAVATILVAVVPLLLIAGFLVARQNQLQRQSLEKSLQQTALALSVAVDRELARYETMLQAVAQSDDLQADKPITYAYAARVAEQSGAVFLSLFDRNGNQLFNTMRPENVRLPTPYSGTPPGQDPERPPVGDPTWLKQAFQTGRPVTSDLLYGLVAQRLIFIVNVPVIRNGQVAFVVNAGFEPSVMSRLLENPQFKDTPAVIYDRKGFIVGRWTKGEQFAGQRVRGYEAIRAAESGTALGRTIEGIPVLYSYAWSRQSGWGVNVGLPLSTIEPDIQRNWEIGAALAALGVGLGAGFAFMLSRRLTSTLAALAESARNDRRPDPSTMRTREMALLAEALSRAVDDRKARSEEREARLVLEAREAEMDHANRMKDRFISLMSHELRNPLAPIRNAVPLLRAFAAKGDLESIRTVTDMIDRQSGQLTHLLSDLLDVSRITSGKIELQREKVDLRVVAGQAVESVVPETERHRQTLETEFPQRAVPVVGDPTRLVQIISNLLGNACKFTPDHGRILIGIGAEGTTALLRVRDDGQGMTEAVINSLFTAFGTSTAGQAGHFSGLGLGLWLARELARAHGGEVRAHSDGPGKGSEFTLSLPLAP